MNRFKLSSRALCFALIIAAAAISTHLGITPGEVELSAYCQSSACSFPACDRDGERFDPATGNCEHGGTPPLFLRSHRVPTCRDGERLDRTNGRCILEACDDGCEARTLCTRKGEQYARSGRDRDGAYGVCDHTSGLGYRSHRLVRCPSGFVLNESRGVCVRCPIRVPVDVRRPDLMLTRTFLRVPSTSGEVTRITAGTSYLACFEVANRGTRESGPFSVGGGGLGVRTPPSQAHASLVPGASRVGCLEYPTTPPAGTYRLELRADSLDGVREFREDNNTGTLVVNVVPR